MRGRLFLLWGSVAVLLAAAACSPGAGEATVAVTCDEFSAQPAISREARVRAGATVKVTLCSNPSTGFSWEEAQIADPGVVEQVARESVASKTELPGSPGAEVWTFKALKRGTTAVSIAYSRPWEGGEKAEWTFTLTVVAE